MAPLIFAADDKIEVKRSGAWFPASVLCCTGKAGDTLVISYANGCDYCVIELVSATSVRPLPPAVKHQDFRIGEFLEVFQANERWRRGQLLGFCEESRYTVLIEGEEMPMNVGFEDLRPCFDWIDGYWISPSCDQKRTSKAETGTRRIKLKIKCSGIPLQSRFSIGNKVEVRSDEVGYEGSWYTAKILGSLQYDKFLVEYDTLKTDDETSLLQEVAKEEDIRLSPPDIPKIYRYKKGQAVDVWYNEGWWEGVISKVIDNLNYIVHFPTTNEELMYPRSGLRPHQDWIGGNWVVPVPRKSGPKLCATPMIKKSICRRKQTITDFRKGIAVEVKSNEEGFVGAWYSAVIVEPKAKNKFLVEYKTLRTDNGSEFLKELVDAKDMRPCPPQTKVQFYEPLQKVDVWYNEGWWEGIVFQVLGSSDYGVYFSSTDEEMEFDRSCVRLHQEWTNGQWIIGSKLCKIGKPCSL